MAPPKSAAWPQFPTPGFGNAPTSDSPCALHYMSVLLCREHERAIPRGNCALVALAHASSVCEWTGCREHATEFFVHGLRHDLEALAVTRGQRPQPVKDSATTMCRMATADFVALARSMAGTTILLTDDVCRKYSMAPDKMGGGKIYIAASGWRCGKKFGGVRVTVREALFLTAHPAAKAREVLSAVRAPGAGPTPVIVPTLVGDEASLFGDGVRVVVVSCALQFMARLQPVTAADMAAADVVVFPMALAAALCGHGKGLFNLKAVPWGDGIVLTRLGAFRHPEQPRRLKRFGCAMFWHVAHTCALHVLRPVLSPAHFLNGTHRVDAYTVRSTTQVFDWLQHLANHD